MVNLLGKRVLITGASGGIGADLARELAGQGAEVALAARRKPEMEALAEELRKAGARVSVLQADLSTRAGVDALVDDALAALGRVDVLVNNAGIDLIGKPWDDGMAEEGERLMQVNVLAPMRLTARLVGDMVARGEGCVVFVSSVAGWAPLPSAAWYSASKGALARFAETVRIDLKGTGVDVVAVYPGPVHTPMLARALEDERTKAQFRFLPKGSSVELARRVSDAMTQGHGTVFYPSILRVTSWFMGLSRFVAGLQAPSYKRQ
jgi:short-subunit dehydrogenase